jgi:hypothetical protein
MRTNARVVEEPRPGSDGSRMLRNADSSGTSSDAARTARAGNKPPKRARRFSKYSRS